MSGSRPRPLVLCVLDGWGHRRETDHNAIALAQTPHYDGFLSHCPHSLLAASAADVGLPAGQMGNSEVGHMNLGAGRVVVQDLPRVDAAIADGSLFAAPAFARLAEHLGRGGTCHLMGLLSPGGVHAHQAHLAALARALTERGGPRRAARLPRRPRHAAPERARPPRALLGRYRRPRGPCGGDPVWALLRDGP